MSLPHTRCPLLRSHTYQHRCLDTLHSEWNIPSPLFDRNSTECHIPSYSYIALLSAALSEQHPCQVTRGISLPSTAFQSILCGCRCGRSFDSPSIFAPEGTHGGYGTWQLIVSEEGFPAAQNVYYLLMKAQQSQSI